MDSTTKRGFLLAKGWIQAVVLVTLFGFFVLGFLAYKTYTGEPPIPGKLVNLDGQVITRSLPNRPQSTVCVPKPSSMPLTGTFSVAWT